MANHHNREFKKDISAGDFHKFRYWEIVEAGINDDSQKRDAGTWRITEKGRAFVEERITVPKLAYVYNRKVRGFHVDHVGSR